MLPADELRREDRHWLTTQSHGSCAFEDRGRLGRPIRVSFKGTKRERLQRCGDYTLGRQERHPQAVYGDIAMLYSPRSETGHARFSDRPTACRQRHAEAAAHSLDRGSARICRRADANRPTAAVAGDGLQTVSSEEDAIEAAGASSELLEDEDMLVHRP